MIPKSSRRHPVDTFFTIVLFSLFLLFLLLMLLFSAQAYRTAVSGNQTNNNLYTASAYITAKFRQHDDPGCVSARTVEELDNTSVLCLTDTVNGREYVTYIYLWNQKLKELFTAADNSPSAVMGTDIASLDSFSVQETEDGFYSISLRDLQGNQSSFFLHPGSPVL